MRNPLPVLFLDWQGVERGFLDACLEPGRVSKSGKNELAKLGALGRKFTQTGHALRRRMLPYGVTIAAEPARRSARWLLADLVQKQRAPVRGIEDAFLVLDRSGECAALVAEKRTCH